MHDGVLILNAYQVQIIVAAQVYSILLRILPQVFS